MPHRGNSPQIVSAAPPLFSPETSDPEQWPEKARIEPPATVNKDRASFVKHLTEGRQCTRPLAVAT